MKRRVLKIVGGLVLLVLLLVTVLVVKALTMTSRQIQSEPTALSVREGATERLAESVRFETISNSDPSLMPMEEYDRFAAFLQTSYPRVHATMELERVPPCSLVYRWRGKKSDAQPVLVASHIDVVPVEDHESEEWTHGPFSGAIADGFIWGRGTLDDKVGVVGLLEAAEILIASGHKPSRDVVLAFGCDEEVGGTIGAQKIARMFAERGEKFEFAADEGLAIAKGYVPGIAAPVALIGIVEKGFATYVLTARVEGGHSSMPPKNTAIGVLSRALAKLEENQMPAGLNPVSLQFFETLGPEANFAMKLVFANLWLLEPVLVSQLEAKPSTNASVRTTTAVTIFRAGVQDNVLPKQAVAKVNFRVAPGDTLEQLERHIVETIDDDRITVELQKGGFGNPASAISDVDAPGYRIIAESIRAAFGNDVVVAPSATTGGTDVRHYEKVSENQYRFAPVFLEKETEDTARIHGVDERISIENWNDAILFYGEFLRRL